MFVQNERQNAIYIQGYGTNKEHLYMYSKMNIVLNQSTKPKKND